MISGVTTLINRQLPNSLNGVNTDTSSGFNAILDSVNLQQGLQNNGSGTGSTQPPTVAKKQLSLRYFLLNKFMGETVPVLDTKGQLAAVGTVIGVTKTDTNFLFTVQTQNSAQNIQATGVFQAAPLADQYTAYKPDTDRDLRQKIDMEQRLNAGIGPLLDRTPDSYSSNTPIPTTASSGPDVGPGEAIQYVDPQTQAVKQGLAIIYQGQVYLKDEGSLLTLHLEKQE